MCCQAEHILLGMKVPCVKMNELEVLSVTHGSAGQLVWPRMVHSALGRCSHIIKTQKAGILSPHVEGCMAHTANLCQALAAI